MINTFRRRGKPALKQERIVQRTLGTMSIQHTESWGDVVINDYKVHFSPGEGTLLKELAEHYGTIVSCSELHQCIGITGHERPTFLRYIRQLRSKLALYELHIMEIRERNGYLLMHYTDRQC